MLDAMGPPLNASSIHDAGRKARYLVEQARGDIADALDARHADITFTSGATESNNMVLAGFDTIITSAVEHSAIWHRALMASVSRWMKMASYHLMR